jgi:hypothetical protein
MRVPGFRFRGREIKKPEPETRKPKPAFNLFKIQLPGWNYILPEKQGV